MYAMVRDEMPEGRVRGVDRPRPGGADPGRGRGRLEEGEDRSERPDFRPGERSFDSNGEFERGHRTSEVMLNLLCVKLTGQTCDERFAGTTQSARIPDGLGLLGEILANWYKEVRAQAVVGIIVEQADEFDEDGMPVRMPARWPLPQRLQPIRTPGGTMHSLTHPPKDLGGVEEQVCLGCEEVEEDG